MGIALLFGEELLDGGEDYAAGVDRELAAQVGAALGLGWRLAQELLAAGEGAEELVVEVVAVGEHDDGRILHRRLADDGAGVEGHGEAFAGALGVPDDTDAAVAGFPARLWPCLIAAPALYHTPVFLLQLGGPECLANRDADGVELVIAGYLLDQRAAAVVLEDDEVAEEGEEEPRREDALQHYLQLGHTPVGQGLAGYGAPGFEPLAACGEGADAGLGAVGNDERLVHAEQCGQFGFVGLELVPCRPDGGVLVGRVFEFDDSEGQAVEEEHDVGAARVFVLADAELVDRQPVVGVRVREIDNDRLRAPDRAVLRGILDCDAIYEQAVEGAVAGFQGGACGAGQLAEGVVEGRAGELGVEVGEGVAQTLFQNDLVVAGAFGGWRVGGDVRAVCDGPADSLQPVEGGLLHFGFGEGGHCGCGHCFASVRSCCSSVNIKRC